jgi:hypothetical protein
MISQGLPRETPEQRANRLEAERHLGTARYFLGRRKLDLVLAAAMKALQLYPACLGALCLVQQLQLREARVLLCSDFYSLGGRSFSPP